LISAIVLLLLGSHLEYIKSADLVVFIFTFLVSFVKIMSGIHIYLKSDQLSNEYVAEKHTMNVYIWYWLQLNKSYPLEMFFALSDSIKYI
jgi:hypothetical protein